MIRRIFLISSLLFCSISLSSCQFGDTMRYLYGSELIAKSKEQDLQLYHGDNRVSLTYDANYWETPYLAQEDTISVVAGNSINYTAVLLQRTDQYSDFLKQSGDDLKAETTVVEYPFELEIKDADVKAVRYDCGSYQAVFAELNYHSGDAIYVSAATYSGSTDAIAELLKTVYPTPPES